MELAGPVLLRRGTEQRRPEPTRGPAPVGRPRRGEGVQTGGVEVGAAVGKAGGAEEGGVARGVGVAFAETPEKGGLGGPGADERESAQCRARRVGVGACLVVGGQATGEEGAGGEN